MKPSALITGASGGIGLELAKQFARHGTDLVLVDKDGENLERTEKELESRYGISVLRISKDLTLPDSCTEIYDCVKQSGRHVKYLVNNAGVGDYGMFSESDWNRQQEMISVNIIATIRLCRLFLPGMIEQKEGCILNLSSVAAFQPGPLMSVYDATKSFVLCFSEAIANETRGTGVTVTVLCPGPTTTGFLDASGLQESKLFFWLRNADAGKVAEYGYHAMLKGKRVAIYGLLNRFMVFMERFFPRRTATAFVRRLSEKK